MKIVSFTLFGSVIFFILLNIQVLIQHGEEYAPPYQQDLKVSDFIWKAEGTTFGQFVRGCEIYLNAYGFLFNIFPMY